MLKRILTERWNQHQQGWFLYADSKKIAILYYKKLDPPFYLFTFDGVNGDKASVIHNIAENNRAGAPELSLQNQRDAIFLASDDFLLSAPGEFVSIRDLRKIELPLLERFFRWLLAKLAS